LAEAGARWTHTLGQVSDDESQFSERVGQTEGWTDICPEIVEASAEVLNEGEGGDDDPGGKVSLQPAHRSKPSLQASVVGLQRVVRMDLGVMEGRRQQLSERARIDSVPIGNDLDGRDPGPIDRSLEEVAGCFGVPARWEEDVDDLAELVDGPEQVAPRPSDLQVGLIDMPAISDDVLSSPSGIRELRREPLDPP
jgi:hypothetical protein